MIDERSFTREWVSKVNEKQRWGRSDAQLKNLEKAIMALNLLEQLVLTGLPFIFKGGTSLFLHLQRIERFSVDIDILVGPSTDEQAILAALEKIVERSPIFISYGEVIRRSTAHYGHYQFNYRPFVEPINNEILPFILLDIARAESPYIRLEKKPINADILDNTAPDVLVTTPSVNGLLADKLTAFAPETIGVPITAEPGSRPKRVEALKQLFDVSNLFTFCNDLDEIRGTYHMIALQEIQTRHLTITPSDALTDTMNYALMLGKMGNQDSSRFSLLAKGIPEFRKFVANQQFSELDAARCAGKAAYIVRLIREKGIQRIERFSSDVDMAKWEITQKEYVDINLLKMIDPEAFFYWYHALI